jgi:hypothetical protein
MESKLYQVRLLAFFASDQLSYASSVASDKRGKETTVWVGSLERRHRTLEAWEYMTI